MYATLKRLALAGENHSEVVIFKKESMETKKQNKGGRPTLDDPAKHRHVLYLNERDNARFLAQWEQSGVFIGVPVKNRG